MDWRAVGLMALMILGLAGLAGADDFDPGRSGPGATRGWVRVPEVVGLEEAQARQVLSQAGLQARVHRQAAPKRACYGANAGQVIRQSPAPGENQRRAGWVEITLCPQRHKERRATMPDLHGLALAQAKSLLSGLGVKPRLERRTTCPAPDLAGKVVGQSLPPGAQVKPGQVVVLRYCPGPPPPVLAP